MIFEETAIPGVWHIRVERRGDARGSFARAFCATEFADHGLETSYVQANIADTVQAGTVRGMHWQVAPHEEVKIVRCVAGAIHDVAVDARPDSPTYLQSVAVRLSAEEGNMLYVPPGFAHGYQALTDGATTFYMVNGYYAGGAERGLRHDDPALALEWPLPPINVSDKDRAWPLAHPTR